MQKSISIFVLFFNFMATILFAQPARFESRRPALFGRDLFLYSFYNFAGEAPGQSKAILHLSVVNDVLTFIKQDDKTFVSDYEIAIIIYNREKEAVAEKSIRNSVTVNSYKKTNSRIDVHAHQTGFSLPAGEYEYQVTLYSHDTAIIKGQRRRLVLRAFDNTYLQTSDLVFAEKLSCEHPQNFVPNLRKVFDDVDSDFAAFFMIYPHRKIRVPIAYQIQDNNAVVVHQHIDTLSIGTEPMPYCIYMRDHINRPGQYELMVRLNAGKRVIKMDRNFSVFWGNLSMQKDNMDIILQQLKLIAKGSDIEKIKAADKEEQMRLYDQFWQQRDPTPDTPVNELKKEFFRRVDFANRNFTELVVGRPGWKTDRGRIYIKNGAPTEVEKHITELDRPHAEIWYYAKLNQRYIFTDRDGTGQYRLVKVE